MGLGHGYLGLIANTCYPTSHPLRANNSFIANGWQEEKEPKATPTATIPPLSEEENMRLNYIVELSLLSYCRLNRLGSVQIAL